VAQHDYIIANQSGAATRSDLNNALAAIATNNSQDTGTTQPSTPYRYQWYADPSDGLLKIRNAANSAWITVGTLANANLGLATLASPTFTGNVTINAQGDLRLADSDSSNWVALQAPVTVASNLTFTAPAADGTADQSLVTDGAGALSFASRSRLVRATAVATTSGTSIDFTSIPSWVRRITVLFTSVSTSGTSPVQIQLGDSGGFETTGYTGTAVAIVSTNSLNIASYTSGAVLIGILDTTVRSGSMVITNIDGNQWQFSSINANDDVGYLGWTSAIKTLSATLDRVRLTTINGTDTFDAGSVNIIYEG
jgi:hypothetical protein